MYSIEKKKKILMQIVHWGDKLKDQEWMITLYIEKFDFINSTYFWETPMLYENLDFYKITQ